MDDVTVSEILQIAICDDEKAILSLVEKKVKEVAKKYNKRIETRQFENGKEFLKSSQKYDIVFMDIELENENGLEVLDIYRKKLIVYLLY